MKYINKKRENYMFESSIETFMRLRNYFIKFNPKYHQLDFLPRLYMLVLQQKERAPVFSV